MSFAQERLWFLEQLETGSGVYNIYRAWRLAGRLNLPVLEASLNEVVRRHETLRSSICVAHDQPVQVVQPPFELKLAVIDLSALADSAPHVQVQDRIRQIAETPFEFSSGKFLRAELLRVADGDHILILATHHIVSDAWSIGVLTRELWSLYEARALGKPSPLAELPVQYADFAVWQRGCLQGEVLQSHLSYWKEQLKDHSILYLPTDRPRPPRQSFRGARISITLPEALTIAINNLSGECGVTPFMTLLAAFQVLLYRYSGQEDIVIGSPIANRSRSELEALIGFFVNTLVLRSDLSGNPTFKELLSHVRDVCLAAYAHQEIPFEKLVQELQPERDQSRNLLFQVMFALQNATSPFGGIPGLRVEPVELTTTRSLFDLSLFLRERDAKYMGYIEYNTELFDYQRIERMAAHFQTLLQAIAADPNQTIAALPILTEAERHQILFEWNDTAADYPHDKCIHQLIEEQVERTPERRAVSFNHQQLTYRELNRRANQLAHYLRWLGVGPEVLVGICIERSLEMVVGLLAILKAGGAYVPLDPAYPKERLRFILEDAQCSVLLTGEGLVENRGLITEDGEAQSSILGPRAKVICFDRDWAVIERESAENPSIQIGAENLAYVIYTSGSTGAPKGVAIEHRSTVNLLYWAKGVFTGEELSGVLASTSICFDLSAFELFVPLSWGGKVILVDNILSLHEMPGAEEVTLVNAVPSAMSAVLGAGRLPRSLKVVNLAGEPLSSNLVDKIYETGTVKKVYDLYGPSETTTYSTYALRTSDGFATIGRPISNTTIFLLDPKLEPVPVGVAGELCIGGRGVFRGYLRAPELTAAKFIPNRFGDLARERLYRTGDLARYFPDGNVEYLGRLDDQLKIRGSRIEPGEIESVLKQHPAVKESVVVVRDRESGGEKDLVAYFIPRRGSTVSVTELFSFVREKLPAYMIPAMVMALDELPLTPNGKIDRNALPPPDKSRLQLKELYAEPRTQVEELLSQIWKDVLNIEEVSIYDNFFELGGHSLLAIQIVSRVREAFDKDVPVSALFDTPTVAGLASTVEKAISGRPNELPPIVPVPRDGPLPLSMNQEHLWRLDRMIPGTHFFNMPYVYRLSGDLNVSAVEKALQRIIRRHEALRTVFGEIDGRPVQIIQEVPELQLPVIDLRGDFADEVSERAADFVVKERQSPFDLKSGPLLRIKLLRLTDADYLLLVTLHHIISDDWSMQIFRRELIALYKCYSESRPSPLLEPSIQFGDYAAWERKLLDQNLLEQQLKYWKLSLALPLENIDLWRKTSSEHHRLISNKSDYFEIKEGDFKRLKTTALRQSRTVFMYVICAVAVWIHYLTREEDVRIVTLLPNRRSLDAVQTIGPFANKVVLRMRINPDNSVEELLKQVKEVLFPAYQNQELPFEILTRVLEKEIGIKHRSFSTALLLYTRRGLDTPSDDGLFLAPVSLQQLAAQVEPLKTSYDLTFRVTESSTQLTGTVNHKHQDREGGSGVDMVSGLMGILWSILSGQHQIIIRRLVESINGTVACK